MIKPILEVKQIENHIKPGWIEISYDSATRKIITTSNQITNYSDDENDNGIKVLNALVDFHKKRTQDYNDMWGYDMWEKTFTFKNSLFINPEPQTSTFFLLFIFAS